MNRICVLALAALSLPFAIEAAAQTVDPASSAKPAPAASTPATPSKAAPAPQKTAAAPTMPVTQKTAATTSAVLQKTAGMSQQDKMRYCNKEATGKKGAERKTFMKSCLSSRKSA